MKNLTKKELDDFSVIVGRVLNDICRFADKHNIDRDSALMYFARMITDFSEITTIKNYEVTE